MSEAVITIPGYGEVIGYEALTATGTKAALTATKYIKQADVAAGHMQRPMTARVAVISLSVANIRWTSDGTAPVAATTTRAWMVPPVVSRVNSAPVRRTAVTSSASTRAPSLTAWSLNACISSAPLSGAAKPG